MAFDQSSIPNDLRPLNNVRTVSEETRIAPVTTSGRPVEAFYGNQPRDGSAGTVPAAVYYSPTVSDAGFVGVGFTNAMPTPGVTGWVPRVAPPVPPQLGVVSAGLVNSESRFKHIASFGARSHASDQASDEGGDDSTSWKKVKFLCSFGGKILPRPSDAALRYVGGQTRIISVKKDVSFDELVKKMEDIYGESVVIKYQLPEEDLDALVSVSCPDDLENMMDEYEKLTGRSSDGSAKLRVFLFSASEVDAAGGVQFSDLRDGGQKYFEAVNGILEGVSVGGLSRKESTASAASTQNSEFSGADAIDTFGQGHGEVNGPPSAVGILPGDNSVPSQEATPRTACTDPGIHVDASTAAFGFPVMSGPPPAVPTQLEREVERSAPVVVAQHIGVHRQPAGVTFPATSPYMQTYVDTHQETSSRPEYVQYATQLGFPEQILRSVAPAMPQQHIASGVTPQQYMPALHVTMPPSSHASVNSNMVPTLLQQQIRLEQFPAENTLGHRVVQLPASSTYNTYQAQVHPSVTGGYGWHQVPHQEQVAFPEGWMSSHQVTVPENITRFEDCTMCQKALPHAHSDTIAQDQKESQASNLFDPKLVHYSLQLDDKGRPVNRNGINGAHGEVTAGQQGTAAQVGKAQVESMGVPQNFGGHYISDRFVFQKGDHSEQIMPLGVLGYSGGVQSPHGMLVAAAPQSYQDNSVQQVVAPVQYQIRQDPLISKPANEDHSTVGGIPSQPSDYHLHEPQRDYSSNISYVAPRVDNQEPYAVYDHLRRIEGGMENLQVHSVPVFPTNGQNKPLADTSRREDISENRQPKGGEMEAYWDTNFSSHHTTSDGNQFKQKEMLPVSASESPYSLNPRPIISQEVAQPLIVSNLGSHPHTEPESVVHGETFSGNSTISGADTTRVTDRILPIGEWKDQGPPFQSNIVPTEGDVLFDGNAASSSSQSPSYGVGHMQENSNSLFSHQDPWNFRQDTHYPPPRPKQIQLKKETFNTRDPSGDMLQPNIGELPISNGGPLISEVRLEDGIHQTSGNLSADFNSENLNSNEGSAEELIKQELQAVAEGVAASVLQASLNSNPDVAATGKTDQSTMSQENIEVQKTNVEVADKDQFEEVKAKRPEKTNIGSPLSEGIGRLQIIKNSDLEELRELGSGTFGTVYHGKWRGTDVAIKRINDRCFAGKASEQDRMRDDFWNEAIKLADLHHPNVVAFYGVVLDGPGGSIATVTEYMVNGSLRTALQKNERNLDKRKRLLIAMDVAFGMEYLHGKNIVHFDLKSDNLLVNLRDPHRPICKVGDLGLSKVKCQTLISGGVRGTLPWMAPELLNGSSSLVSEKVDVYSFGIVLWELLTGEEPYADLHYGAIIGGIVSNTLRPSIPETCDPDWGSLMERCWSSEPSERPNFTEIVNDLRTMTCKTPAKGQMQQQSQVKG